MNQRTLSNLRKAEAVGVAICLTAVFAADVFARVGGGGSYGGGGGHGGGGGGAGALIYLLIRFLLWLTIEHPVIGIPVDIIVIGLVIYWFTRPSKKTIAATSSSILGVSGAAAAPARQPGFQREFNQLRRFDPNFSEIIFTDFCYALYGRAHEGRGQGPKALDLLSPYLSEQARASLLQLNSPNLKAVQGVIVGAMQVADVRGLASPTVCISIEFDANYTEFTPREGDPRGEMSYYVRERWELERKRDVLSPTPEQATALHCPRCGAPLQKDTAGACAFCRTKIDSGEFQWYVRSITTLSREARGPLLTSDVQEVGTDYPTVMQPNFAAVRATFEQNNPEFSWAEFQARARLIFNELQEAWSTLKWAPARADLNCPNCGASLKVNAVGVCEFCKGKITSGEFDWVLSKIEQDESYSG